MLKRLTIAPDPLLQALRNGTAVTTRRFSHEHNTVKPGDWVRCIDGMRFHGKIGQVTSFVHDGKKHPVMVTISRADGSPGKRRATFYEWEKCEPT